MKIFASLLLAAVLTAVSSCAPVSFLRFQYPDTTHKKEVSRPYDAVFDDVIDFMVEHGWSLDKIDRQNGIAEMVAYLPYNLVTYETKSGAADPAAFAVSVFTGAAHAHYGRVIFRVKPIDAGKSSLGVRMVAYSVPLGGSQYNDYVRTKTTGVFEQSILDALGN